MPKENVKSEVFVSHSNRSEQDESPKMTKLNFSVPIEQATITKSSIDMGGKRFLIQGTAINATLTRNGVKFTEEELEKSAQSLRNKPLLKDHNNSVDSIVGKTTNNVFYDSTSKCVKFEAEVIDEGCKSKIKAGLIGAVSVGCMVSQMDEEEDCVVAKGIDFVELSLVAVPADPNAGIQTAISCSLQDKKKATVTPKPEKVEEKIEIKMEATNEKQTVEQKVEVKSDFSADVKALTEELKTLKSELSAMKEVKVKVEDKVESKGIVANVQEKAPSTEFDNYELIRENGANSFSCKTYTHSVFKRGN
jgi:hypothetical protein